jgi:hypothetical protein
MNPALLKHSTIIEKVLLIFLWCCAGIMFVILCGGMYVIILGVYRVIVCKPHTEPISVILNGLELIFVSPLIYLLMLSLTKYINSVQPRPIEKLKEKGVYLNNAMLEIMTVKILSVSLFISILILHAIDLVLLDEMTTHLIVFIGVLLVILIAYYCILDHYAKELKKFLDYAGKE